MTKISTNENKSFELNTILRLVDSIFYDVTTLKGVVNKLEFAKYKPGNDVNLRIEIKI